MQMRARCWLFFSFMVSFGSVAGAVAVLLKTTGSGEHVQVGVVSHKTDAQCCCLSTRGLVR